MTRDSWRRLLRGFWLRGRLQRGGLLRNSTAIGLALVLQLAPSIALAGGGGGGGGQRQATVPWLPPMVLAVAPLVVAALYAVYVVLADRRGKR